MNTHPQDASSKAKILASARQLFIQYGYNGTTTVDIAKLSEVSQGLVFHYFGNKKKLWQEVRRDVTKKDKPKQLPNIQQSFDEFLQDFVLQNINYYHKHNDFIRIQNWHALESNKDGVCNSFLSASETEAWLKALAHYQQTGEIKSNVPIEFLLTFILSIIHSAAVSINANLDGIRKFKEYADFCIQSIKKVF